ncbi:MAG: hydroxymethylbilane synthase [Bacteroidetes bacterium]|nr:hydroxymethylbilane synthase [Bacteroidota bacterium]MBU1680536.1 hydroxymethylbilane synthase [Bacteroidota bacterium]
MKELNKIVIGSRSSDLALWQAKFVKRELEKNNTGLKIKIKLINTKGDKILDVALSKIGDKGLFTKELEVALLNKEIDIAVHSLKDLQTDIPKGLVLAAVIKRHDVEDVLIARKKGMTIEKLPEGATVATGSLRRRSQLKHLRPDIKIVELRGNVPTRIKKFLESNWDGIILARAGVERLKLKKYVSSIIPLNEMLPAVGQGALGIEIHKDNKFAAEVVKSIHDANTYAAVIAERTLLKVLEGGCQVPIGAYAEVTNSGLYLDGFVGSLDGFISFRKRVRGKKSEPEKLGRQLASDLKRAGAKKVLNEIYTTERIKK